MRREELERTRLLLIMLAGLSSLAATVITLYINYKKNQELVR